jgi:hypothetical protein
MTIIAAIVRIVACCKERAVASRRVDGIEMDSPETDCWLVGLRPIDDNF